MEKVTHSQILMRNTTTTYTFANLEKYQLSDSNSTIVMQIRRDADVVACKAIWQICLSGIRTHTLNYGCEGTWYSAVFYKLQSQKVDYKKNF